MGLDHTVTRLAAGLALAAAALAAAFVYRHSGATLPWNVAFAAASAAFALTFADANPDGRLAVRLLAALALARLLEPSDAAVTAFAPPAAGLTGSAAALAFSGSSAAGAAPRNARPARNLPSNSRPHPPIPSRLKWCTSREC